MPDDARTKSGRTVADIASALGLDLSSPRGARKRTFADNDPVYSPVEGVDFFRVCQDGERTAHLTRIAGYALGRGMDEKAVIALCLGWNTRNDPPLDEAKVSSTVASLARTHARNHPAEEADDTPLFDLSTASVARFIGKEVPARDWVLENCLPRGKVGLIVAPGGTGKSQLVLQLGYAIATGLTKYTPWKPGRAGQVLIVCAEDEEDEVHRRFDRLLRADVLGADPEQVLQRLRENLLIVPRVGDENLLTRDDGKEVRQTGYVERLAKTIAPLKDLRLIVIDPAARFRGGEENAAEDTTRFVEAVETLAKITGSAVFIVHHVNKSSMQGGDQNQSASRGSSALTDGVRLQINLGYPNKDEQDLLVGVEADKCLVATITKTNYSARGEPIYLRRDDEGRLFCVDLGQQKQTAENTIIEQIVATLREEEARKHRYSKSSFANAYAGPHNQFKMGQSRLKRLIDVAVGDGRLLIEPGKDKLLRPPLPIVKARPMPGPTIVDN